MGNNLLVKLPTENTQKDFIDILQLRVRDSVSRAQLLKIIDTAACEPEITVEVTDEPTIFARSITLPDIYRDLLGRYERTTSNGIRIYGSYTFGKRTVRTNIDGSWMTSKDARINACLPAAAAITTIKISDSGKESLKESRVVIYIPKMAAQLPMAA